MQRVRSNSPHSVSSNSKRIYPHTQGCCSLASGPGGLHGPVTPENFTTVNSYRNPIVAEAMKGMGYINRFGYGIQRAQRLLAENGNPPAEFRFDPGYVAVTIRKRTT